MTELTAIIPARGGSRGVPRKNIAPLAGKPLIGWTIEAARRSRKVARVIVTTDDPQIAEVARRCGAETPFLRPFELAQDDTPGICPLLHAVHWLECEQDYRPDQILYLQPTSPLRTTEDIDLAAELMQRRCADAVVSVTAARHHPYWAHRLEADGRMADFMRHEGSIARRQDLPAIYDENGALYLVRRDVLIQRQTLFPPQTYAYIMPPERSLDIDTPWDLHLAELLLQERLAHVAAKSRVSGVGCRV